MDEKVQNFKDFVDELAKHHLGEHEEIDDLKIAANNISFKIKGTHWHEKKDTDPRAAVSISLPAYDGHKVALQSPQRLTTRKLSSLGKTLGEKDFSGLLIYSLDSQSMRLDGLSALEPFLVAFETHCGLSAGLISESQYTTSEVFSHRADLTKADYDRRHSGLEKPKIDEHADNERFYLLMKERKVHSVASTKKLIENDRVIENSVILYSSHSPFQNIEDLESTFLAVQRELGYVSSEPTLVLTFMDPTIEALGEVAGYERVSRNAMGIYDQRLRTVVGKLGNVYVNQGCDTLIDALRKPNGDIVAIGYVREPSGFITLVPSIETWQKLDSDLGSVKVAPIKSR